MSVAGAVGEASAPRPVARSRPPASELAQWWVIASAQFRDYLRTHRFLGLAGFVAIVSMLWLSFLFAAGAGQVRLSFLNSYSEFLADYMSSTGLWIILAAAFFAGDALSVDFNTGTGFFTLVLPVRRRTMLAGRYASAAAVTLVIVLEYTVFGVVGTAYEFGRNVIPWGSLATSLGLAVLFTFAVLSVAFCLSAFFRAPTTGVLVTALLLIVGLVTIQSVVQIAGFEPWWSLPYAGGSISAPLDWAYTPKQVIPIGGGFYLTTWTASPPEGAWIMLAYLVVFALATGVLYQRKESTG